MDLVLNSKELKFLQDTEFLKTKHDINLKIHHILNEVEWRLQGYIKSQGLVFPEKVLMKGGKISKGENYHLLPYMILDYPRYFHYEAVFAFRTMFLWGSFFSCTLHLQGKYLELFRKGIAEKISSLLGQKFYIAVSSTPWEYHYHEDNYKLIDNISSTYLLKMIESNSFIKMSRNIDILEYQRLPQFSEETFGLLMKCLHIQ
ncbi:MAG: hypothetical protein M3512_12410 [Bacteroidota bacterium]|nr:hypothetical protein [Bacteroidota bacterium]